MKKKNHSKILEKRSLRSKLIFRDKKGHEVNRVSIRITETYSARALPYFYCQKCDRFIPANKKSKKIVTRKVVVLIE